MKRRTFLKTCGWTLATTTLQGCIRFDQEYNQKTIVLNDIHSKLNATQVANVFKPKNLTELQACIANATQAGKKISIAGGRHAMGGQQFGEQTQHIDSSSFDQVIDFDPEKGLIEVQAGIQWPALIQYLHQHPNNQSTQWSICQKQTGADRLSLGGALSANIHGRGLVHQPLIQDIESFTLINSQGNILRCSRKENSQLFQLCIGGYGLFGMIHSVQLRLVPRFKVKRIVDYIKIESLIDRIHTNIKNGFTFGDFQFSIDETTDAYLREGIFTCYKTLETDEPITEKPLTLNKEDLQYLLLLAHTDRKKAYDIYTKHYLSTSGQLYWSDTQQLSDYAEDYHPMIDQHMGCTTAGSEMMTEIYVPRENLVEFMHNVRKEFLGKRSTIIYGTIRMIQKEQESFLAWAREDFACIIFNLHVDHHARGIEKAKQDFQCLIDLALKYKGCYYLTYHRWARQDQVEIAYPMMTQFLKLKKEIDPQETFQSQWYRHYRKMFA